MGNINKGKIGENIAVEYLINMGCRILARNYRGMGCEADIVAMDGDVLAFVEVKARSSRSMGSGREAVDARKRRNIIKAAKCYLMEKDIRDRAVRFDVAEVDLNTRGVVYLSGAFEV